MSSRSRPPPAAPPLDAHGIAGAILEVLPAVMGAVRGAMRRQLGEGLSVPQFRCLRFIADNRGSSVSEVAAFLGVTPATASAMIDRLVRAGCVRSATASSDRRRSELTATLPGRALVDRMRRATQAELAVTLAPVDAAELNDLANGLAVLQARFRHG